MQSWSRSPYEPDHRNQGAGPPWCLPPTSRTACSTPLRPSPYASRPRWTTGVPSEPTMTEGDRGTGAMSRSRLETFADGVFAIAATLLILNVDSQVGTQPQGLGGRLLHIWPSYLAYAVSFVTIGIIWVQHHALMQQLGRVNRMYLLLT